MQQLKKHVKIFFLGFGNHVTTKNKKVYLWHPYEQFFQSDGDNQSDIVKEVKKKKNQFRIFMKVKDKKYKKEEEII